MTTDRAVRDGSPRWWRIWQGQVVGSLVALTCAVILFAALAPAMDLIYAVFAFWALGIIGIAWLAFALIGWMRYRTVRRSLIAPALLVATAALVVFSVPFSVGFWVSKSALDDVAANCDPSSAHSLVGVFRVDRVIGDPETGCHIYTKGGFLDWVGLAHLPAGIPADSTGPHAQPIEYDHITGDWYRFSERF